MPEMAEDDLRSLVDQQIRSAVGYQGSTLVSDRQENWRYYRGEAFGNERKGRSQVVSRDVMDTVEWIMPSIVEAFHGNDEPIAFAPRGQEDEEAALQATDYVNYIYQNDNPGFEITYDWVKDGLISKAGVTKVWWEVSETVKEYQYSGLTDDEMTLIAKDPAVKVLNHTERKITDETGSYPVHDLKLSRRTKDGQIKVETVPPEEFLLSARARSYDNPSYCGHRRSVPRSDLIADGYDRDVVEGLPGDDDEDDQSVDSIERYADENRLGRDDGRTDKAMQNVTVTESYLRVDYDGDGIAELRKIVTGGRANNVILKNEPVDRHPFIGWSPIRLPHTAWGLALVDAVKELQLIKSTVLRQMLDGLYLTNNPRMLAQKNAGTELNDLLNAGPGGVIRTNDVNSVKALDQPWNGAQAFPMLEYLDKARDSRTGTGQSAMAMNPDSLNNQAGADANSRLMTQAEARVKLIARVFAEVGFKRLAKEILRLTIEHQDKPRMIRMRNKFVPIDPRSWNADMDVIVKVGLGTGDKAQLLQGIGAIAQKQETILLQVGPNNPLVSLGNYYNTLKEFVRLTGLPSVDPFFSDPTAPDPQTGQPKQIPPPPPDPKMVEAQGKAQIAQAQLQADQQAQAQTFQFEQQKHQAQIASDQQAAQMKAQAEADRQAQEFALKREQIAAEIQLKREQLTAELQLKQRQFEAELAMNERLEMQRIETSKHIGAMNAAAKVDVASSRVSPGGEPG